MAHIGAFDNGTGGQNVYVCGKKMAFPKNSFGKITIYISIYY